MRRISPHLLGLMLFLTPAIHTPRAMAQTQSEMNAEAAADFAKADAGLNKIYKQLMAVMEDATAKEKLKAAQRAWVALRDAQAEYEADTVRGGSMAPLVYDTTRTELTNERIAALKKSLAERKGGQ